MKANSQGSSSEGLTCAIENTSKTNAQGKSVLEFVFKNTGDKPIKICSLFQVWRHELPNITKLVLSPDQWKSDPPTKEKIAQATMTIKPGGTYLVPLEIGPLTNKQTSVEVSYVVSESFGRNFQVWHGEISAMTKSVSN